MTMKEMDLPRYSNMLRLTGACIFVYEATARHCGCGDGCRSDQMTAAAAATATMARQPPRFSYLLPRNEWKRRCLK
jgi:hypothetical protein